MGREYLRDELGRFAAEGRSVQGRRKVRNRFRNTVQTSGRSAVPRGATKRMGGRKAFRNTVQTSGRSAVPRGVTKKFGGKKAFRRVTRRRRR